MRSILVSAAVTIATLLPQVLPAQELPTVTPLGAPTDLPVPHFRPAVAVVPPDGPLPRAIVVAAHGNFDRPEWQCRVWQRVTRGTAFVLCPRGSPRTDASVRDLRYTYHGSEALIREVDEGIAALHTRYGASVDDGPIVYVGFSLGAILGVSYFRTGGNRVSVAVMVEGDAALWTDRVIHEFQSRGGRGVLFACGQSGCVHASRRVVERLRRAGIAAGVVYGAGAGHLYWGPVLRVMQAAFPSVVADDPRFAG